MPEFSGYNYYKTPNSIKVLSQVKSFLSNRRRSQLEAPRLKNKLNAAGVYSRKIWQQYLGQTFSSILPLNLLHLGTVITFDASLFSPNCNNGFITFRTNGLLHLGPYYI